MGRKYPAHKVVLAELHLSEDALRKVCKETQVFLKNFRTTDSDGVMTDQSAQSLSEEWLKEYGKEYFVTRKSTYTWPEDAKELISIIARLMSSQSTHLDKRRGPHTGKRIHQEVSGLLTWANQQQKRLRTRADSQPDYDEASTPEYTSSPKCRNDLIIPDSPATIRTSYIVKLGTNRDGHGGCTDSNNMAPMPQDPLRDDDHTCPAHQARLKEQPFRAASYEYQTPIATPVLTSPFEPTTNPRYSEAPPAIVPPTFVGDDQRSISEQTEEAVEEQTFTIDCNGKEYGIPDQKCANVLQLTLLLLEQLKADLRVAVQQRKTVDSQAKVAHILVQIEEELKR